MEPNMPKQVNCWWCGCKVDADDAEKKGGKIWCGDYCFEPDQEIPEDTPSLDTSFHDHERGVQ